LNRNAGLWVNEKDWLVELVWLNELESCDEAVNCVGKLLAFALVTDTRALAQVGDPDPESPVYELWFSFRSEESKKAFLDMVRNDGCIDPDDEYTLNPPPSLDELPQLQPPVAVLPGNVMGRILAAQLITLAAMQGTTDETVN
jgi:hypothetical protein